MVKQKVFIFLGAIAICVAATLAIVLNLSLEDTMDTMEFIAGRYKGGTLFVDYDNSIGVDSTDDVGYWRKGDNWYIKYGKLELEFTPKDLTDQKMLAAIGQIGLDVRGNLETNELTWYFAGEKLEEWVPN